MSLAPHPPRPAVSTPGARSWASTPAGGVTRGFHFHEGTFTTIEFPGASLTQAWGINPQGDIVGQYVAGGITHGFLLDTQGNFFSIDIPGASSTAALAITPQGDIVGQYTAGGITHGFLARR